ncbi:MAG: hypothetical protein PHN83_05760 [Dysgonamonadaceae bacterium]|nr:hypothetical protein [Dysgonamonadaceae bacterium]
MLIAIVRFFRRKAFDEEKQLCLHVLFSMGRHRGGAEHSVHIPADNASAAAGHHRGGAEHSVHIPEDNAPAAAGHHRGGAEHSEKSCGWRFH